MNEIIHISFSNILKGWVSSSSCDDAEDSNESSVGRIAPWGAHYIATIHDDVPEDEREEVADFIAAAPQKIRELQEELEATNTLLDDLWVMDDANEMRNKIRAFSKKT